MSTEVISLRVTYIFGCITYQSSVYGSLVSAPGDCAASPSSCTWPAFFDQFAWRLSTNRNQVESTESILFFRTTEFFCRL